MVKRKFLLSRRIGKPLWGQDKDPANKKNYPPGQHGKNLFSRRTSEYGRQLLSKQTLKTYYGCIKEKQFRKIFEKAQKIHGDTGSNLLLMLESRLDAIVYRSGMAKTIFAAKQMVSHKHIKVNNKTINIPSYELHKGDVITSLLPTQKIEDKNFEVPGYIKVQQPGIEVVYDMVQNIKEIPFPIIIETQHIVEFYSR